MTNSGKVFRSLLAGAALATAMGFSEPARREVSVNINLGPPVVVVEPPQMVLVPRSQVYFSRSPRSTSSSTEGTGGRRGATGGTGRGRTTVRGG